MAPRECLGKCAVDALLTREGNKPAPCMMSWRYSCAVEAMVKSPAGVGISLCWASTSGRLVAEKEIKRRDLSSSTRIEASGRPYIVVKRRMPAKFGRVRAAIGRGVSRRSALVLSEARAASAPEARGNQNGALKLSGENIKKTAPKYGEKMQRLSRAMKKK